MQSRYYLIFGLSFFALTATSYAMDRFAVGRSTPKYESAMAHDVHAPRRSVRTGSRSRGSRTHFGGGFSGGK